MTFIPKSQDADLDLREIEGLAEEIRIDIMGDRGLTLLEYVKKASSVDLSKWSRRKIKALQIESRLEAYFPDEVFQVIKDRVSQINMLGYDDEDRRFITSNLGKGYKWIAKRMYSNPRSVGNQANKCGLKIREKSIIITPDIGTFIHKHADKGITWISNQLNIANSTIRHYGNRMGIEFANPQDEIRYTPKEDDFIRNNIDKGTTWISGGLSRSRSSIVHRARILKIEIPIIRDGKVRHRFTPQEDVFIAHNAHMGATWIGKELNISAASILNRAKIRHIKLTIIRREYSKEDIQFIHDNIYRTNGIDFLAQTFNVSTRAIMAKLGRMGLYKDKETESKIIRECSTKKDICAIK